MAANTSQILSVQGIVGFATLKTAMTNYDGTDTAGSTFALLWTAGASPNNAGGRIERIRFKPRPVSSGSTAANNAPSMAYIFLNNGSANTTAANNVQIASVLLPATIGGTTALAGPLESNIIELPTPPQVAAWDLSAFPAVLPNGYRIYVGLGTTVSAGWDVTAFGGAY